MKKDTVIWSIVALTALAVAVLIAAMAFGLDENTTPIIVTVLGIIAAVVPSMLALVKVDQVNTKIENGVVTNKVEEALNRTLAPELLARPMNSTAESEGSDGRPGV